VSKQENKALVRRYLVDALVEVRSGTVTKTGITIYRISGGRIAEARSNFDQLGLLQQLGVIPAPAEAAGSNGDRI
jgi:hypothetical protein